MKRSAAALGLLLALEAVCPLAAPAQAVASRELQAEATRLFQELAQLRGLTSAGAPPRVVIRSRDERRRFILGELRRKYPEARLDAERRAMAAWGLVPAGFDVGGFLADLVLEQAAAYYDPIGKVMALANGLDADAQREALAHELVHMLQDRQMDLDRFMTSPPGRSDEALARQALVEGEAVALTFERVLKRQGAELARLPDVAPFRQAIAAAGAGPLLARAPRFLRALLTFPYSEGLAFVHQFRRRHGWAELSRLYADAPRSTTQILHPERYLDRREDPLPVSLPDLGPALGPGARRVSEDDAGEFGFVGVLREFLGDDAGAPGWRGDRYALWEDASGATVLVSLSVWASDDAAAAFADAYARVVPKKHGLGPPAAGAPSPLVWTRDAQAFAVERRGREVLLLERVSTASVDAVRRAVWQSRPGAARAVIHLARAGPPPIARARGAATARRPG